MIKEGCSFCDIGVSDFPHFKEYGVDHLDQFVVAQTDHFNVKPDILPGNPDGRHMLIHPKFHTFNYAEMHAHAQEIGGLLYELEHRFGPLAVFEHGGTKEGNSNQSVYHAHFHAYGGLEGFDIISYMEYMLSGGLGERYDYLVKPAPDYAFLLNLKARYNGHPYLYVEQGPWAIFAEDKDESMKSQITQRSMHQFFSGEILDWKKIPENDIFAKESVRRINNLIHKCRE